MFLRTCCLFPLLISGLVAEPIKVSPEWFRTTEFRKRFVGSYGFLPEVEPKVDQEEARLVAELSEILATGRFKEAENRLISFIKDRRNPADPSIEAKDVSAALVFTLGNLYYQNGRKEDAEESYLLAIKRFPDYRRAHKNLALLYGQSDRLAKAKPHLMKAIDLGDADHLSFGLMGNILLEEEKALASESAFRQAYLLNPEEQDWKIGLVKALLLKEDWAQASSMLQSLIDENPENPDMWMQQADCFLRTGEVMRAAENYEVLRLKGLADEAALNALGDIYAREQEPLLALGAYLSAIRKSDVFRVDRSLTSAGYLLQLEATEEAKRIMGEIREKAGDGMTNEQKVQTFLIESDIEKADGNLTEAATLLNKALELSPADGSGRLKLGKIYLTQAEQAESGEEASKFTGLARGEFSKATRDRDARVGYEANKSLASMLVKDQQYIKAIPLIEEALRLREGDKQSIERYLRQVQRAAEKQKERKERLDAERKERQEALTKEAEANKEEGTGEENEGKQE